GMAYAPLISDPTQLIKTFSGLISYYLQYSSQLPTSYAATIFAPVIASLVIMLVVFYFLRAPMADFRPFKAKEKIHGDAKWATPSDVKKAKLLSKKGMLLGTYKGKYLTADGYQHALLFAPTGSGKGVGFVIPNLLYWQDSLVVHDIKLENYELTSGYRKDKLKQKTYLWNAASPDGTSHCYNPLDWVSPKMGQMVDDVQKIASLLLPEQEFWQNEARSLFLGVVLYLLAVPEKTKSFGEVVRTLRSDDVVYNLAVVLDTIGKEIHPVAYMNIAAFLQKADKERSGVISTLNSSLELWANPLIDATTAKSDFDFNMVKREATTIYVGLTPDNIARLKPLMQIFYQQAASILTKHMPLPEEKIGIMFVMDEFPSLGKMEIFQTGIAYFRGYKVRLFLIIQDTEQLKGIYEESGMNSFLSNSTYRITFSANNMETANLISQLIGNKTVKQYSRNAPVFLDLNPASRSKNVSEAQRALLLPQEVIGLPRDEQIILIESCPPIKTKKIFYYKDKFFTSKLLPKTFVPQQEPYDPRKHQKTEEKTKDVKKKR
ncbi:MAG: type IV secretion system protein VirD4, partial [Proteobacteria bacterium]|nr:type IV secretion system protein VirD4 [Pseudomonadota bacterium]